MRPMMKPVHQHLFFGIPLLITIAWFIFVIWLWTNYAGTKAKHIVKPEENIWIMFNVAVYFVSKIEEAEADLNLLKKLSTDLVLMGKTIEIMSYGTDGVGRRLKRIGITKLNNTEQVKEVKFIWKTGRSTNLTKSLAWVESNIPEESQLAVWVPGNYSYSNDIEARRDIDLVMNTLDLSIRTVVLDTHQMVSNKSLPFVVHDLKEAIKKIGRWSSRQSTQKTSTGCAVHTEMGTSRQTTGVVTTVSTRENIFTRTETVTTTLPTTLKPLELTVSSSTEVARSTRLETLSTTLISTSTLSTEETKPTGTATVTTTTSVKPTPRRSTDTKTTVAVTTSTAPSRTTSLSKESSSTIMTPSTVSPSVSTQASSKFTTSLVTSSPPIPSTSIGFGTTAIAAQTTVMAGKEDWATTVRISTGSISPNAGPRLSSTSTASMILTSTSSKQSTEEVTMPTKEEWTELSTERPTTTLEPVILTKETTGNGTSTPSQSITENTTEKLTSFTSSIRSRTEVTTAADTESTSSSSVSTSTVLMTTEITTEAITEVTTTGTAISSSSRSWTEVNTGSSTILETVLTTDTITIKADTERTTKLPEKTIISTTTLFSLLTTVSTRRLSTTFLAEPATDPTTQRPVITEKLTAPYTSVETETGQGKSISYTLSTERSIANTTISSPVTDPATTDSVPDTETIVGRTLWTEISREQNRESIEAVTTTDLVTDQLTGSVIDDSFTTGSDILTAESESKATVVPEEYTEATTLRPPKEETPLPNDPIIALLTR